MHREVLGLHETYGPIVRIGPSEISFIDKAAWKDIYSLKRCRQIERDPTSFPSLTPNGSKFDLLTYSPTDHAKYRKILNPCFSEKATKEYEPTIHENIDKMIDKLSANVRKGDARTNVTKWFQWLTFDMVTDVCWGESFECVSKRESHPCLALSMDLVSFSSFIVFVAWWKGLKDFLVKLSGVEGLFIDLVRSKCDNNLKSTSKKASIYSNLHEAGDPLNQAELDGNLTAIVIAGSETTGFALTATSYYLAKNPECFRKAAAEVRFTFSSVEEINDDTLKKLPYLKATIDEALRMTPAEPNGLARKVVVDDGLDIAGQYIPKETAIYVSQFAANRSSAHFRLPNEYHPERWLEDPEFKDDKLDAAQPFIMGVNVCIGRGLAWMEMRLTLAKMLWKFDWTINDGDGEAFEQSKAWHVWMKSYVHLQLLERGTLDLKA
ncbi:putative cytochrome p450 protein [Eutypa lata UCREL1]|uniref:Putative cytochrome p450 protein n=1 Tax=Eutypa lata (strain UCR-EL1) TaxID=1287681 RepID=M7TG15_EUTLA|nr:putative cytochrome p450 protein [Eutypa lata UCREL1]